jgi:hypothetical protein
VARLINAASPSEVALTSCGTEADNWAITGVVMAARRKAAAGGGNSSSNSNGHGTSAALPHVVTSAIEHPAVLACLEYLKQQVGTGHWALGSHVGMCFCTQPPVVMRKASACPHQQPGRSLAWHQGSAPYGMLSSCCVRAVLVLACCPRAVFVPVAECYPAL